MRWCSVCSRSEFFDWLVMSAMGKFWKHSWKAQCNLDLSAWFRPEAELALPLFLDFKSKCFCCGCIKRSQYLLGEKRDLRMCGVTKGFSQQMRPWGKFLCINGILPRSWRLHTSPLGSVLSWILYCKGKQWTSTQSSAALGSSDENTDSLRMQSYSFRWQVWVPVCRCCPSRFLR